MKSPDQFYIALFLQVTAGVIASRPDQTVPADDVYATVKRITDELYHDHLRDASESEAPPRQPVIPASRLVLPN